MASSGGGKFRDGWEVKCWAEVAGDQTKESLAQELLNALSGVEWVTEDISRLRKEREIIAQIREGLEKPNAEK